MAKTITITPEAMLKFVMGGRFRAVKSDLPADAKITRSGYNAQTGEFWVQVETPPRPSGATPSPQEFRIEIQK